MSPSTYCLLIPNYNHGTFFNELVDSLGSIGLPIIVVNDGSDDFTKNILISLAEKNEALTVLHFDENKGKGKAVMEGLKYAFSIGFSHALQIDADGQHDQNDIKKFLELSKRYPQALISGQPVYDDTIPIGRYVSRYLTHFWVWVETLSFSIKDSMCGFRIYPLASTTQVIDNNNIGQRMDFDIEILVRMFWEKVELLFIPTKVIYPENGVSHFALLRDNWLITKMHTRLVFSMLVRLPANIYQASLNVITKKNNNQPKHWGSLKEKGSLLGLSLMFWVHKVFGKIIFLVLLYPVITYYFLISKKSRLASMDYFTHIEAYQGSHKKVRWLQVYRHFFEFGEAAIDKIDSWAGNITKKQTLVHQPELFAELQKSSKGAVIFGSHLGNLELSRALGARSSKRKVNAVVFNKNAAKFQKFIRKSNKGSELNLIHAENMGIDTAIILKQKIENGELVVIVGDRTSINSPGRVQYVDFLGEKAAFSEGPFIMAALLDCPVYLMFCLKQNNIYNIYLEKFADSLKAPRSKRKEFLRDRIECYAQRLSFYCLKAPSQWFNFYDFWQDDSEDSIKRNKY